MRNSGWMFAFYGLVIVESQRRFRLPQSLIYFSTTGGNALKRHGLASWAVWIGCFVAVVFFMATFRRGRPAPHEHSFSVTVGTGDFGKGHEGTLEFVLKEREVSAKAIWCSLTVSSPRYDRVLFLPPFKTTLTDSGGNVFHALTNTPVLGLKGSVESAFRMGFALNKKLALPAKLALSGYVDNLPVFAEFNVQ
jgi:hypothetical protein